MNLETYKKSLHERPTTLVLIGPSGAGKTTVASKLATRSDQTVSTDALRETLCGDASNVRANGVARQLLRQILAYRADHDHSTIVDTTALKASWRGKLAAHAADTRLWGLIVEASLEACLDRQHTRDRQVPESAIRGQHERLGDLTFQPHRFDRLDVYRTEPGELVEVGE